MTVPLSQLLECQGNHCATLPVGLLSAFVSAPPPGNTWLIAISLLCFIVVLGSTVTLLAGTQLSPLCRVTVIYGCRVRDEHQGSCEQCLASPGHRHCSPVSCPGQLLMPGFVVSSLCVPVWVFAHMAVMGFCVVGGRIVSSKPFAPLNFRINSRNLSGKLWAPWCIGYLAPLAQSDGTLPCRAGAQLAAPQPLPTVC